MEETKQDKEKSPDNRLRSLIVNLNDPMMLKSTENILRESKESKEQK